MSDTTSTFSPAREDEGFVADVPGSRGLLRVWGHPGRGADRGGEGDGSLDQGGPGRQRSRPLPTSPSSTRPHPLTHPGGLRWTTRTSCTESDGVAVITVNRPDN